MPCVLFLHVHHHLIAKDPFCCTLKDENSNKQCEYLSFGLANFKFLPFNANVFRSIALFCVFFWHRSQFMHDRKYAGWMQNKGSNRKWTQLKNMSTSKKAKTFFVHFFSFEVFRFSTVCHHLQPAKQRENKPNDRALSRLARSMWIFPCTWPMCFSVKPYA